MFPRPTLAVLTGLAAFAAGCRGAPPPPPARVAASNSYLESVARDLLGRDEGVASLAGPGLCNVRRSLHGVGGMLILAGMNALIVYHTITGHTRRAAEDIADGLSSEGVSARLQAASEMTGWDVADVEVVIVGSPCHAGSVALRSGLSGAIRSLLRKLGASALAGKVGGGFSVHCAYGGHRTVRAIEKRLASCGARVPQPGVVVRAGVPFSVVTGPMASEEDRGHLRQFGRELARAAKAEPERSG